MAQKKEAVTPRDIFHELVQVAGDDILIGGQALAVWVEHYGVRVPRNVGAISRDVDFLTTSPTAKSSLQRYANVLEGKTHIYKKDLITSLVGQAYKELPNEEVLNVDVLWNVIGVGPEEVRENAQKATRDGVSFLIMHPFDVLRSRLINLHKLPDKQDDKGVMQLRLAVAVMRKHVQELSSQVPAEENAAGRSPLQPVVSAIEKLAIDDAGRKVAERYGVHVADAIDPTVIPPGPFWDIKWPQLKELMSPAYAQRFGAQAAPGEHKLAREWAAMPAVLRATGTVVALSDFEVIQHVGRGKHVAWDRRQLKNCDVAVGENVTIYRGGKVERPEPGQTLGR